MRNHGRRPARFRIELAVPSRFEDLFIVILEGLHVDDAVVDLQPTPPGNGREVKVDATVREGEVAIDVIREDSAEALRAGLT